MTMMTPARGGSCARALARPPPAADFGPEDRGTVAMAAKTLELAAKHLLSLGTSQDKDQGGHGLGASGTLGVAEAAASELLRRIAPSLPISLSAPADDDDDGLPWAKKNVCHLNLKAMEHCRVQEMVEWLRSLLETYRTSHRQAQRMRRAKAPNKTVVSLRAVRDEARKVADALLKLMQEIDEESTAEHREARLVDFLADDCTLGSHETANAITQETPPLLLTMDRLHAACDQLCDNNDVPLVRHMVNTHGVPLHNFVGAMKEAMNRAQLAMADALLDMGLKLPGTNLVLRPAMTTALLNGNLSAVDWLFWRYGLSLDPSHEARSMVNVSAAALSRNPQMLRTLCNHTYRMGLTPEAVDAFAAKHGLAAYHDLWRVMPRHMERLFGSPDERVPYAFAHTLVAGDAELIEYLYDDAVLELTDESLYLLVKNCRTDVLLWIDDTIFKPSDGWVQRSHLCDPGLVPFPRLGEGQAACEPPIKRVKTSTRGWSRARYGCDDGSGYTTKRHPSVRPDGSAGFCVLSAPHRESTIARMYELCEADADSRACGSPPAAAAALHWYSDMSTRVPTFVELWCLSWYLSRGVAHIPNGVGVVRFMLGLLETRAGSSLEDVLPSKLADAVCDDDRSMLTYVLGMVNRVWPAPPPSLTNHDDHDGGDVAMLDNC